jgi:hypothetical protein
MHPCLHERVGAKEAGTGPSGNKEWNHENTRTNTKQDEHSAFVLFRVFRG